jgi:hypothetical protein
MYLSTKLALSSVVIGSIFASIVQSAQAAGISFTPTGDPLDGDPILDIKTTVGATQLFTVNIDQAGLAVGDTFEFQVGWDSNELDKKAMGFQSSDLSVTLWNSKEQGQYQFINYKYVANGSPNQKIEFGFQVAPGLINNGQRDFWVNLLDCHLINSNLFTSTYQEVEVQPVPEPITGLILGGLAAGGAMMNRKKNKAA